jgi:hypothetical protein
MPRPFPSDNDNILGPGSYDQIDDISNTDSINSKFWSSGGTVIASVGYGTYS